MTNEPKDRDGNDAYQREFVAAICRLALKQVARERGTSEEELEEQVGWCVEEILGDHYRNN